jgi:hypothetical protein
MTPAEIPVRFLRECFDYDPQIGVLTWRSRPREHFADERAHGTWNTRFAGKPAFTALTAQGYPLGVLTFGGRRRAFLAHRVIWALMTGAWPIDQIDHINGVRDDNRWSNLRAATNAENAQNMRISARNTSGFIGVSWDSNRRKWAAEITVDYRRRHLGRHRTREAAHAAYLRAKRKLHPFQPVPRKGRS